MSCGPNKGRDTLLWPTVQDVGVVASAEVTLSVNNWRTRTTALLWVRPDNKQSLISSVPLYGVGGCTLHAHPSRDCCSFETLSLRLLFWGTPTVRRPSAGGHQLRLLLTKLCVYRDVMSEETDQKLTFWDLSAVKQKVKAEKSSHHVCGTSSRLAAPHLQLNKAIKTSTAAFWPRRLGATRSTIFITKCFHLWLRNAEKRPFASAFP